MKSNMYFSICRRFIHLCFNLSVFSCLFILWNNEHCVSSVIPGSGFSSATKFQDQYSSNESNVHTNHQPVVECGVWLAPSTIAGGGLGMFAGRFFQKMEEILPTGDSVVTLVDFLHHNTANGRSSVVFLWDEYTWDADALLAGGDGRYSVSAASPGLGAAANSFLPIYNVEEWYPIKDSAGLHRSIDPGAGGFSLYHNRKSTAKNNIHVGEELFVSYGTSWFESRSFLGPIPLTEDLEYAQDLIDKFRVLKSRLSVGVAYDVWRTFITKTSFQESRVLRSFRFGDESELETLSTTNITLKNLRRKESTRSIAWLQQHGICGDHLAVGRSTLSQAGRGAFASRNLPLGTVVAQLPMIHICDRSFLEMFNFAFVNEGEEDYVPNGAAGFMGYQLMLNYCFGHRSSTLLLCPYGPLTNFINHNQSLANVKLRWARSESSNHMPSLLQDPISSFCDDKTAKFAMELHSERDILEGEEILLDYGDEWEVAWQSHMKKWRPTKRSHLYRSAADLNSDVIKALPTIFEQLNRTADPFPPNVELKCDASFPLRFPNAWQEAHKAGTLDSFLEFEEPDFRNCFILRRTRADDGFLSYSVHFYKEYDATGESLSEPEHLIFNSVPRAAFRFFDVAYSDDTFESNAFRHDMRISDDLFPSAWKNLE